MDSGLLTLHAMLLQKAMNLNQQQIQELMALRRWFLPKMGKLLKDRQRISRALQDSQVGACQLSHLVNL